ncbi:hypothetical protein CORMATOL_01513 [Corynebacterium matruchotii ATCC 33806]|uniref:Uncharacterized protein n=2 Tax=Corynebacterium matruchotii TaxID=43768 RepID=E0DET0_9CORY|nr:hypothetical protein CORMATOL_01513 [Corynebacterium matruchotii ATCC 33806]EFM48804.1 hypothetical protein HMPREF0299_6366 [Corynebacterium matruchotii ATCC 14266]
MRHDFPAHIFIFVLIYYRLQSFYLRSILIFNFHIDIMFYIKSS